MSSGFITAGSSLFGWITNTLNTGPLADGRPASTYRSNLQAFLDFLNTALAIPTNNRDTGATLAAP
jgi:hypothetical protein